MTLDTTPRPQPPRTRRSRRRNGRIWPVPTALVVLMLIPLVSGTLRLVEIAGGPALLPGNVRITDSPLPLVLHVVSSAVYAVVGAFQFPARLRRAHRTWHRQAGRVLAGAGLLVAGSGLWMTLFYSGAPGGILLWAVRVVVACALASSIVLGCLSLSNGPSTGSGTVDGVTAIRSRDVVAHRAWMIRAYALAVAAAGTQVVTQGIGEGLFGTGELSTALSVSAGWAVNLALAELIIRRPGVRRARRARTLAT